MNTKFQFRPSALSAVTEQIWKKNAANEPESTTSANGKAGTSPNLFSSNNGSNADSSSVSTSLQSGTQNSGFVFGKNISERAVTSGFAAVADTAQVKSDTGAGDAAESVEKAPSSSFDMCAQKAAESSSQPSETTGLAAEESESSAKASLAESAAKYEAEHQKVVVRDKVDVVTGEEDDTNVFQCECKFHCFDTTNRSWLDRGRCLFRLNDLNDGSSRIVIRAHGVKRVLLNTKLFPKMLLEQSGQKSIKFSAFNADDQSVSLHLATVNPKDIFSLLNGLRSRLSAVKESGSNEDKIKITQKRKIDSETLSAECDTTTVIEDDEHESPGAAPTVGSDATKRSKQVVEKDSSLPDSGGQSC